MSSGDAGRRAAGTRGGKRNGPSTRRTMSGRQAGRPIMLAVTYQKSRELCFLR